MPDQSSPVSWDIGRDAAEHGARTRARDTFGYFLRELHWEQQRSQKTHGMAAARIAFGEQASPEAETVIEELWIGNVDFDGFTIRGLVLDDPAYVTSVRRGTGVQVPIAQLTDWLYAIEGRAYGGFTVQAARAAMTDEQRMRHAAAWALEFGDPYDVAIIPTHGTVTRTGRFGRTRKDRVALDLAAEHPMALEAAPRLFAEMAKDTGRAMWRDDRGWTHVHRLALAGSRACVRAFLDRGADPSARTNLGLTPTQLAATVGWTPVVELLKERGGR